MAEVYNSNVGEVCDEYNCNACDNDVNARKVIIIDIGCSAHMFSDWRVFQNFCTTNGVQVKCANGQLVGSSGVGDVGFLKNVLLVPQLKANLISEGKLALPGWEIMTYNRVKDVYDEKWNKIMVAVIQNDRNPLYIVDPSNFPAAESANLTDMEGEADETAFAGMADQEEHEEKKDIFKNFDYGDQQHWIDLHSRPVNRTAHPVHEVRRIAWIDWYTQFNHTLYDHDMTGYDNELWTQMTQFEWGVLAPRETNWRADWYQVTPMLRDHLDRLHEYDLKSLQYTEISVAQAWLDRYGSERTSLDLHTPTTSLPLTNTAVSSVSGWGNYYSDWGGWENLPTPHQKSWRQSQRQ